MESQLTQTTIPQDFEAEQAVLGAILADNGCLTEVAALLTPLSFFSIAHQHIFGAMMEMLEADRAIDEYTLGNQLKSKSQLDSAGGYAYLAELALMRFSTANVQSYGKIVQEMSLLRELITTTTEIAKKSRAPDQKIGELLAEAEAKIAEIATRSSDKSYAHIRDILPKTFETLERNSAHDKDVTGLPTGFADLDHKTSGLQPSDLIIVAARPAMGKTAFALNIAKYVATRSEAPGATLVFSLEMSKEQLVTRLLSAEAKVDSEKLRSGNLEAEDWDKLAMATDLLSGRNIYINDTPAMSCYEVATVSKQLHKEFPQGVSLVIVDYLQLMKGSRPNQPREQEISEISRSLKGLAKELQVPVIALSQLNRALESRTNKRPQLSDLRESGAIEQDADLIMFIYRDEVYDEDSKDKGIAEIIIGKHRNGSTGTLKLVFTGRYTTFSNLSLREADVPS
ncbi:MAG: replicative DNA helicase [Candidatus Lambdaproteobacteria bacterium RIFOXYD1_FULL_56_27]|uniref:Replicative DNA helicase n=1 Tax=Candidatus Lambdaproteobacteria bacterium RIFOXYD2_FULL_56_26 TaxID=1817773 RepID=A0A1F6GZ45_9PROT|nr:MAG: replicative DNA helicase [Candidatus Lambdaproteobacteria bacterium RIFOXYC1_FULL_56_13]OGH03443.1 MAG: replicative DNA helicase [Candidatus Lambdaproteobacteria bacterium RIFOXYD2_FULL_56_26]OGH08228.1 MAG: replicative DNA helicase [Candidatus Lambdaproteobacteria bacterium RIFOXYD1_FULL_56_27]